MNRFETGRYETDCRRCRGLCCITFGHEVVNGFPEAKPADQPCRHLRAGTRCGVFPTLEEEGYTVCRAYDCNGAGPLVSAWVDTDGTGVEITDTAGAAGRLEDFRQLSRLHMLVAALSEEAGGEAARLRDALDGVSAVYERAGVFHIDAAAQAALRRNESLMDNMLRHLFDAGAGG